MSDSEPIVCNYYSRLPLELWGLVMECLPRADQRSCLSVSAAFHDLACPILFSRIVIRYGVWSTQRHAHSRFTESDLLLITWRNNAAKEILQRIARDAQFARSVKTISVFAYQYGLRTVASDLDIESRLLVLVEASMTYERLNTS